MLGSPRRALLAAGVERELVGKAEAAVIAPECRLGEVETRITSLAWMPDIAVAALARLALGLDSSVI